MTISACGHDHITLRFRSRTMQTLAGQQQFHPVSRCDIGSAGGYKYTEDVLALERCKPVDGQCEALTSKLNKVCSPLRVEARAAALHDDPNQLFASYLMSALREGFRIGFNRDSKLVSKLEIYLQRQSRRRCLTGAFKRRGHRKDSSAHSTQGRSGRLTG